MRFSAFDHINNDDLADSAELEYLEVHESLAGSLDAQKSAVASALCDLSGSGLRSALTRFQDEAISSFRSLRSLQNEASELHKALAPSLKPLSSVAAQTILGAADFGFADSAIREDEQLKATALGVVPNCLLAECKGTTLALGEPPMSAVKAAIGTLDKATAGSALASFRDLAAQTQSLLGELDTIAGIDYGSVKAATAVLDHTQAVFSLAPSRASVAASFKPAYLDDLRVSVANFHKEESERLKKLREAQLKRLAESLKPLAPIEPSGITLRIKRLVERHGKDFTLKQIYLFEAVARTAEKLLATRQLLKIRSKLGYLRWVASYGSKLLQLYVALLSVLCIVLEKVRLEKRKVFERNLKRFVRCLSPPPVQPLSRLPRAKPNAPNAAA